MGRGGGPVLSDGTDHTPPARSTPRTGNRCAARTITVLSSPVPSGPAARRYDWATLDSRPIAWPQPRHPREDHARLDPATRSAARSARPSSGRGRPRSRPARCRACADDADRPTVEVERPANAEHGDFATNLAMKLARPYRMAPLAIAHGARGQAGPRTRRAGPDSPIEAAEVAPPGFLNLRLRPTARSRRRSTAILARARRVGPGRAGPAALGQRRVRVGQPDRAAARSATPAGRSSATCSAASSRPAASEVTREYYFNDSGGQIDNLGASVAAVRRGEPRPGGRLPGRLRRAISRRECRTTCWAAATADGADAGGRSSGAGRPAGSARAIEASLAGLGVRFDVWTSEASLHEEGWVERAVERLRERGHVYEQDGALWFRSTAFGDDKDRVIFRSERRADLLRGRHRLRDREVQPRLRPPHLHLGRRPPRHGRPGPQRRRGDGLRPDGRPDAALLVGPLRARRRRGLDVASAPASSSRSTSCSPRSASTPRAGSSPHAAPTTAHRLRHRAGQEAVEREPGLLRPVRPRPDRVDPAQGGRGRPGAGDRRSAGTLAGGPGGRPGPGDRAPAGGRRGRRRGRGDPGHHGLRDRARDDVPRLLPRRAGRRSRRAGAIGGAARARARRAGHARQRPRRCSGSPRPSRCSGAGGRRVRSAGQAAGRRPPCPSVASSLADDDPARRAALAGQDLGRAAGLRRPRSPAAVSNSVASAAVSQSVCIDHAPRRRPARRARPGGRRPSRRPRRSRLGPARPASRSQMPQLVLAEGVLERHGPARPEPRRQIVRERHGDRAPRRPGTCRGGGSARSTSGRSVEQRVDRGPATRRLDRRARRPSPAS